MLTLKQRGNQVQESTKVKQIKSSSELSEEQAEIHDFLFTPSVPGKPVTLQELVQRCAVVVRG
jgi:hypothetical protein